MTFAKHATSALALVTCAVFALGSGSKDKQDSPPAANGAATPTTAPAATPALKMVPLAIQLTNGPIKELVLDAPEGAKLEQKGGGTFVTFGKQFSIGIVRSTAADIKAERQAATSGHGAKPVVDTDTPDLIVFHQDLLGTPIYDFMASATVDKTVFSCVSSALDGQTFSNDDIPAMTKACKSLRKK